MTKFIRFDEDHYGYLVNGHLVAEEIERMVEYFDRQFEGKRLIVVNTDEFIDLTGKYEIVPIPDAATTTLVADNERLEAATR